MTNKESELTQQEIRKEYEHLMVQLDKIEKEKAALIKLFTENQEQCSHPNVIVSESGFSAHCSDCGLIPFGWYCPESPDMECNYEDPDTGVYDEDVCIYCGQPEERK